MSADTARHRDPAGFIAANTRLLPVAMVPEIVLHVADEAVEIWTRTEEELGRIGLPAPFWAFAWAGGQALARHLLDTPSLVAGKRVLDFASGSGLVAIAALKAGAKSVLATDIDPICAGAMALNARANGVQFDIEIADVTDRAGGAWDLICAGDVFYEREMGARIIAWLDRAQAAGTHVLIGDPGRSYLPRDRLEKLAQYQVPVTRALEDTEIKATTVWTLQPV